MKLAIVGASGLVGSELLRVINERQFHFNDLILVASEKSKGKNIEFKNNFYTVKSLEEAVLEKPNIAIFSAGGLVSKEWAPKFAEVGTIVIDNSSAWRMDDSKKLIVPEVNASILTLNDRIISNPNCSTIQMVVALNPIFKKYGLKRLVISTYQSVTGTGAKAVQQLENERQGLSTLSVYPHLIDKNCLPHGGDFEENGYTSEEMKLVNETRKIFDDSSIQITATVVRVPVIGGHSESVNIETNKPFDINDIIQELKHADGIILQDNPTENLYPMPITSHKKDEVFVGRIRRDFSIENGLNMWIVADNLRKGAATNAVQIAEYLVKNKLA